MKKKPINKDTSITRSSAAEYLTFLTAKGEGGVEAVYADEDILKALGKERVDAQVRKKLAKNGRQPFGKKFFVIPKRLRPRFVILGRIMNDK
jgi:hypothetical protein